MELKSNYEEEEMHISFYIMLIIMAILFLICGGTGINQLINEKCDIGIIIIFGLLFFFVIEIFTVQKLNEKKQKKLLKMELKYKVEL